MTKQKTFDEKFKDSNEITLYNIVIVSENDEIVEFDGVRDHFAREVFDLLKEQASDEELS